MKLKKLDLNDNSQYSLKALKDEDLINIAMTMIDEENFVLKHVCNDLDLNYNIIKKRIHKLKYGSGIFFWEIVYKNWANDLYFRLLGLEADLLRQASGLALVSAGRGAKGKAGLDLRALELFYKRHGLLKSGSGGDQTAVQVNYIHPANKEGIKVIPEDLKTTPANKKTTVLDIKALTE